MRQPLQAASKLSTPSRKKGAAPVDDKNLTEEQLDENEICETFSDEDDAASEYNDTASQFAELEDALNEANDRYMRLFAEYDNYRKRTAKEKTETYQNASAKCIEELLTFIDSFERSLESECTDENFKNGMQLIWGQLRSFLDKMNVTAIEALGDEFDPNIHNAISQQDGTDYASNHVCAVYQKGYMLGDKLIRPAMVAVAV
ncbi:MAG: nucleotide exchange factor GrpE [Ruminococcus sp.]|nr:nucleotide exchange factor GrpE [Ruminococcus sp.]